MGADSLTSGGIMEPVKYSDLKARIDQLVAAGADLCISKRYNYYAIENKSQSATLCTGTKAECAKWLQGFSTSFYAKR
jgi:hypothetical protein